MVARHANGPDTYDLYSLRPNGTHLRRLTRLGAAVQPAWSRNGKWVAFSDHGDILIVRYDGRRIRRLVTAGYNTWPAWSPNGHHLVFVSDRGDGEQLYRYDFRSRRTTQITEPGRHRGRAGRPTYSPKGDIIVFQRDTGGHSDLYLIDQRGHGLTRVTDTPDVSELAPDWSPDAQRIAYYRWSGTDADCVEGGIWLIRPDGTHDHRIVDTPCSDVDPTWSPNGRWVMWQSVTGTAGSHDPDAGVFVARTGGKHRRTVLSGANRWFSPDWQHRR